ncbi:hypothetical protein JCM5350_003702 [Sporobolomyces pararoseus]
MNSKGSDVPPQAFYSSQHESSIGHSAGFSTTNHPQPRPSFQRPASTVGPPTTITNGNGDRPRNTTVVAPPPLENISQIQSSRPSTPPPPIPASSLPYASRTREDPVTSKGRSKPRGLTSSKGEKFEGEGGGIRAEKEGYPSRPSKDPRYQGKGNYTSSRRNVPNRRRKRKQLPWWKQPRTFIALVVLIIVVGIAVGLGVGLTAGKKGNERSPGNPGVSSNDGNDFSKAAGIQPSVSVASTTTTQSRPTVPVARRNRMFGWEEAERKYREEKKKLNTFGDNS